MRPELETLGFRKDVGTERQLAPGASQSSAREVVCAAPADEGWFDRRWSALAARN
jgi:hypothetical protein